MTEIKRRGRPSLKKDNINKARILACAKSVIESAGLEGLSFRSLAKELGVTPMAIRYHVGSRDRMVADLIEHSFRSVIAETPTELPAQKLSSLLLGYCDLALANSSLVLCMLHNPKLMPESIIQFTDLVRQQTQALNSGDKDDAMLNLLIDHLHGFVFSATAASSNLILTKDDYAKSLNWLLDLIMKNSELR